MMMASILRISSAVVLVSVISACGYSPNVSALQDKLYGECRVVPLIPRCAWDPGAHSAAAFIAWEYALNDGIQNAQEEAS